MQRSYLFVAIAIGALLVGSAHASTLLDSATWNGHTYYLVQLDPGSRHTWDLAQADVSSMFGSGVGLAGITSRAEDDFLHAFLAERGWEWWVGGYQQPISEPNPRAGWTWVTREPFVYTNWCSDEPNDAGIPGSEQHLALDFGGRCWNDEGSAISLVHGYVAETFGTSLEAFVAGFYTDVLGRGASAAEIASWAGYLMANPTTAAVAAMVHTFLDGPEYLSRPSTQVGHVTLLYELFLDRTPADSERDGWAGALQAGFDSALPVFVTSPEFSARLPDPRVESAARSVATRLYIGVLGREPSGAEEEAWAGYIIATGDVLGAAAAFFDSVEYTSVPRTLAEHVRILYRTFLGREPTPGEIPPWTAYLQSFRTSVEDYFVASPEFRARLVALGLTGGSTPPTISNLLVNPASVPRGTGEALVGGTIDFVEPDGDLAFVRITVVVTGQTLDTPVSTPVTSGRVLAQIRVNTSVPGTYAFTVQAFDQAGNGSNRLTGFLTITP